MALDDSISDERISVALYAIDEFAKYGGMTGACESFLKNVFRNKQDVDHMMGIYLSKVSVYNSIYKRSDGRHK